MTDESLLLTIDVSHRNAAGRVSGWSNGRAISQMDSPGPDHPEVSQDLPPATRNHDQIVTTVYGMQSPQHFITS
jgi:hypothetical protein